LQRSVTDRAAAAASNKNPGSTRAEPGSENCGIRKPQRSTKAFSITK
jgi:hypothetical protein